MIAKIDFDHLCQLARIDVDETEKGELKLQLEKIIQWMESLRTLEMLDSPDKALNDPSNPPPLRKDEVHAGLTADEVMGNAPDWERGFIKVPKVFKVK